MVAILFGWVELFKQHIFCEGGGGGGGGEAFIMRNIWVKLFWIWASSSEDIILRFFYIYSSGGHFVWQSGTVYEEHLCEFWIWNRN